MGVLPTVSKHGYLATDVHPVLDSPKVRRLLNFPIPGIILFINTAKIPANHITEYSTMTWHGSGVLPTVIS